MSLLFYRKYAISKDSLEECKKTLNICCNWHLSARKIHFFLPVPCTDTFDRINNMHALSGTRVTDSSINTVDECEDYCLDRSFTNCAGFDFNDRTDRCWIHDEDNVVSSNRRSSSDSTLYIRLRCGNYDIYCLYVKLPSDVSANSELQIII